MLRSIINTIKQCPSKTAVIQLNIYFFRIYWNLLFNTSKNIYTWINDIDSKPLHAKIKLLLYSHYVLSKLSWHFTVTTLSKTWVTENIDPVVNQYICKWLQVPISGTLSSKKFGHTSILLCWNSSNVKQCFITH
jgi:hypothetical protein